MTDTQGQYQQPAQPAPAEAKSPSGFTGWFADPATLAATGLLLAVLCATFAGFLNMLPSNITDMHDRMMALTDTVDVGDIALLGIAVALLIITPDPPGGIDRPVLLRAGVVLGVIISIFGVIRSVTLLLESGGSRILRGSGFLATMGVAVAAATIAFYAAREAKRMHAEDVAAAAAAG